jgi:hypothetical protein
MARVLVGWSVRLAVAGAVLAASVHVAGAQDATPARPYRGLFGGTDPNRHQQLELIWTTTGAYDDDVTADTQRSFDQRQQVNGSYGAAAASLRYDVRGRHATFAATGGVSGRFSPDRAGFGDVDTHGDATFTVTAGKSTSISAFQAVRHQPYYQLNFLPSAAPPAPSSLPPSAPAAPLRDGALASLSSSELDGRVQLVERFGTRSSLTAGYAYRYSRFTGAPAPSRWQFGNASFSQGLSRYVALRLGYGYGEDRDGLHPQSAPVTSQNIDLGVDYTRPLSRSRRTTLGFSSGSTVIAYQSVRYYRFLADASLTREIGRTWNARITYHRGIQFVEGISSPLYADNIQTRVGGLLSRRVEIGLSGGYSNGQVGLSATDRGYRTYSGAADLGVALSRSLSLRVQYFRYYYDFGGAVLPGGVPSRFDRQGVRLGISGWLPLVN